MSATYTKLKNGEWGIRIEGSVSVGQFVPVKKKDGTINGETVAAVLWSSGGVSVCSIATSKKSTSKKSAWPRKNRVGSGCCAECGENIASENQRCWETGLACIPE